MRVIYAKGSLKPRKWVRRWMAWLILYPVFLWMAVFNAFRFAMLDVNEELDQFDWNRK